MTREYKPLKIVCNEDGAGYYEVPRHNAIIEIMHASSRLVRAGKDSGMTHYLACVKYLEEQHGFTFEKLNDDV